MLILGHVGIGKWLARPWSRGLPRAPLLLGVLLPDLIDKPVFYLGRALELGVIDECLRGTRGLAHTLIGVLIVGFVGWARQSLSLSAVALGMATHLTLDLVVDPVGGPVAVLWPFLGFQFPLFPHGDLLGHFRGQLRTEIVWGEGIGLALLVRDYARSRLRLRAVGHWLRTSAFPRAWRRSKGVPQAGVRGSE